MSAAMVCGESGKRGAMSVTRGGMAYLNIGVASKHQKTRLFGALESIWR